jgi:hypothetical protein
VKGKSKDESEYWYEVRGTLRRVLKKYSIVLSTDFRKSHFTEMDAWLGKALTSLRNHKVHMRGFLKWINDKGYAVDLDVLATKISQPRTGTHHYWTDEERRLMFIEMVRPIAIEIVQGRKRRGTPEYKAKMGELAYYRNRKAIFAILWLMLHWAIRPKEASRLIIDNWDPRTRRLYIPASVAKNRVARDFVVDKETARLIAYAAGRRSRKEPLFLTQRGRKWNTQNLGKFIRQLIERLQMRGSLYSTRHTACTNLCYLLPRELNKVKKVTGHLHLSQLQRYLHDRSDDEKVAGLVEDFGRSVYGPMSSELSSDILPPALPAPQAPSDDAGEDAVPSGLS